MKTRFFAMVLGICLVCLIGVALFVVSRSQTEAPIAPENITPTATRQTEGTAVSPTPASDTEEVMKAPQSGNSPAPTAEQTAKMDAVKQQLLQSLVQRFEGKTLADGPDIHFSLQEIFDTFADAQGVERIDIGEIGLAAFQERGPGGDAADYEPEMAAKVHAIVFDTPGDFRQVLTVVEELVHEDQDFLLWNLAYFKGDISAGMGWMMEQILVAGELEAEPFTVPPDMSSLFAPAVSAETSLTPPSTSVESAASQPDAPAPMSASRITTIRDTLSSHGTDEGVLHLLETDEEAANWLLERFGSSAEIEAWIADEHPPAASEATPRIEQPLPTEVQP